jgi:DNA-binding response OmpR family regulator
MEELIVRIQHALKLHPVNQETVPADPIQLGKFSFHVNRHSLRYGKEERKLSFRETELLKLLYANRGNIIERKEILNLLWGNDSFFNSRNLDVYITKLRGYLKEDPDLEIITVKGIGYRFVCS